MLTKYLSLTRLCKYRFKVCRSWREWYKHQKSQKHPKERMHWKRWEEQVSLFHNLYSS